VALLLLAALLQEPLLKTFRSEFVDVPAGPKVAKYEVTQELWEKVVGENPSKWKGRRNSVEMLSFTEAVDFCAKITGLLRDAKLIEAAEEVRLPAEAEWETFARGGTSTAYSFGDDPKDLDAHAWHTGNAAGNDPPVGAKRPNPWGLYDVHGYLWEWCSTADGGAVLRGGSWKDAAEKLTSAFRRPAAKNLKDDAVGLRCVLAKKP
jgi:formylglycine-generating enzyme required for sulfatase activity